MPEPPLPAPGLYAILDGARVPASHVAVAALALVDGGATVVQLRLKGWGDRQRLEAQRVAAKALEGRGVWLCVNDRPDLARILRDEAPAGVHPALHLGQDDLPPPTARRVVGPDVLLGLSTHRPEDLVEARSLPVDYVGYGPVFPTRSKRGADPAVGLVGLGEAVRAAGRPVVGIGGITPESAVAAAEAGARWVAVIGALYEGLDDAAWERGEAAGVVRRRAATLGEAALVGRRRRGGGLAGADSGARRRGEA